jgi:hypothetical protein
MVFFILFPEFGFVHTFRNVIYELLVGTSHYNRIEKIKILLEIDAKITKIIINSLTDREIKHRRYIDRKSVQEY